MSPLPEMDTYEQKEFEKLQSVIRAASQNNSSNQKVRIETSGVDPHCSVSIEAYVLAKFVKAPK